MNYFDGSTLEPHLRESPEFLAWSSLLFALPVTYVWAFCMGFLTLFLRDRHKMFWRDTLIGCCVALPAFLAFALAVVAVKDARYARRPILTTVVAILALAIAGALLAYFGYTWWTEIASAKAGDMWPPPDL